MFFDEEVETLASTYEALQREIVSLFQEHWEKILTNDYETYTSTEAGSYHTRRDLLTLSNGRKIDYDEPIQAWKERWFGRDGRDERR